MNHPFFQNKPFRTTGFIGIAVIIVSLILMGINPKEAPKMMEGFKTPILAFEFVQTNEEIVDLFGSDAEIRADLVQAFDLGSKVDFIYMIVYSAFLFSFSQTAVKQTGRKLFYVGLLLAGIIFLGDLLENVQLLRITAVIDSGSFDPQLALLPIFTWVKWGGLALYFLLLTPYFFSFPAIFPRIIGIVAILVFALGGSSFLNRSALNEYYALSIALMFVLMIGYSFWYKEA
ncbi:MAG: hypothetical protein GY805_07830 [Chloroflexi bacterium]|nr:hypothetical protein [Chloroflexota bacterium]